MFGFDAVRAPARFSVLVMFALAVLSGLGWRELSRTVRAPEARRLAVRRSRFPSCVRFGPILLIVLAAVEYLSVPLPLAAAPPRSTAAGHWLRSVPGSGPVVYLPIGIDVESTPAMVASLEHRRPIVNGYSGQRPEFYTALVDSLATFPGDEALLVLKELGVRFVVTPPVATPGGPPAPLAERARFADAVIYELHWTPEIEERLAAGAAVTPTPPGPVPFAPGETASYAVYWTSAGVHVAAGQITLAVEGPPYTLAGTLQTAPWMARFFEARDTFRTRTDAALMPQIHERDQREGSRHIVRTFVYLHDEGLVRIGRDAASALGDEGITLPLAANARDAVSAIYYARTLPLADGDRHAIPVNEAGRNLVVELVVAGRERISVQGRETMAIRLDARMRRRAERRRPVTVSLWLADDERRIPVALDLDAAFGRVRVELIN
jgi:hypothetical protein